MTVHTTKSTKSMDELEQIHLLTLPSMLILLFLYYLIVYYGSHYYRIPFLSKQQNIDGTYQVNEYVLIFVVFTLSIITYGIGINVFFA